MIHTHCEKMHIVWGGGKENMNTRYSKAYHKVLTKQYKRSYLGSVH